MEYGTILKNIPNKYAELLLSKRITYDEFLELTKQWRYEPDWRSEP